MKTSKALVLLLCFLSPTTLFGQGRLNQPGPGRAFGYRDYDPSTARTIRGEVTKIDNLSVATIFRFWGVHITLKDNTDERIVHLGPGWFLKEKELELKIGDRLEIYASNILLNGAPVWIAAEVKRGNSIWLLRDRKTGVPYWAAWGSKLAGRGQGNFPFF